MQDSVRRFLGELRSGTDLQSAAIVSELTMAEAKWHAAIEQRGGYADIVAIKPPWSIEGDRITFEFSKPGAR